MDVQGVPVTEFRQADFPPGYLDDFADPWDEELLAQALLGGLLVVEEDGRTRPWICVGERQQESTAAWLGLLERPGSNRFSFLEYLKHRDASWWDVLSLDVRGGVADMSAITYVKIAESVQEILNQATGEDQQWT